MKRKCKHIISSKNGRRAIYIDEENYEEIFAYLMQDNRHKKKFQYIVGIILEGYKNTELYDKEDIDGNCKDVTAMKFFKGQENDRIYCKEITTDQNKFVVVAAALYERKKTTKLSNKEKTVIKKVGGYEYEI